MISLDLARKLGLALNFESRLKVEGVGGVTTYVTARTTVKVTLGASVVYHTDIWCGNIGTDLDVLLGMDFMVPAGVRLSTGEGTVHLPDEETIPLIAAGNRPRRPVKIPVLSTDDLYIAPGMSAVVPINYGHNASVPLETWMCRGVAWVTSLLKVGDVPTGVRVVNITALPIAVLARTAVAHLVERGHLPDGERGAREGSVKYQEWQLLIYEMSHSREHVHRARREDQAYNQSLPPAVEKPVYQPPTRILRRSDPLAQIDEVARVLVSRPGEQSNSLELVGPAVKRAETPAIPPEQASRPGKEAESAAEAPVQHGQAPEPVDGPGEAGETTACSAPTRCEPVFPSPEPLTMVFKVGEIPVEPAEEEAVVRLARVYKAVSVAELVEAEEAQVFYHEGTDEIVLEELRDQLAMLPEIDTTCGPPDMATADVGEPDGEEGSVKERRKALLAELLERHSVGFLSSGNAVPKPARGVVCDIEVEPGTVPVAEKARRIKGEHLPQVYELLKVLLEAKVIEYSDSAWASPIVIVMKKDGKTIRLCIDYRRVNRLIKLMRYPLPLIDDLLDNFDRVRWLCSLDMASGFWAVLLSQRAKHISAFVCPLGHFQWIRMPFGLKNAPLIYQRVIDNCLWGFVRLPPGVEAEVEPDVMEALGLEPASGGTERAEETDKTVFDLGIPSPQTMGPVLGRSSYIDDIGFGAKDWEEMCELLDKLLYRLRYWGISVSLPKSAFGKQAIEYLSHQVGRVGIVAKPKIAKELDRLQFPTSLRGVQSFLGSLNYYHKFIEDFSVIASSLYELTDLQIREGRDLDRARLAFETLKEKIASPPVLRHPDRTKPFTIVVHAVPWAISAVLAQEHDGLLHPVRFTGRTLQDAELNYHESEKEVLALLRVLTTFYTIVAGSPIVVYTRTTSLSWLLTSRSLSGRCLQWATFLSPWSLEVRRVEHDEDSLAQLMSASITPREKLDELASRLVPAKANRANRPAPLGIESIQAGFTGLLVTFDGAAKLKTRSGSASFVVWEMPGWKPVKAVGLALGGVTVNEAEYAGLLAGIEYLKAKSARDVVVVGDSRIAIQQCEGIINCHEPRLQLLLSRYRDLATSFERVRFVHVKRDYNAPADFLASKALRLGVTFEVAGPAEFAELEVLNRLREDGEAVTGAESTGPTSTKAGGSATDTGGPAEATPVMMAARQDAVESRAEPAQSPQGDGRAEQTGRAERALRRAQRMLHQSIGLDRAGSEPAGPADSSSARSGAASSGRETEVPAPGLSQVTGASPGPVAVAPVVNSIPRVNPDVVGVVDSRTRTTGDSMGAMGSRTSTAEVQPPVSPAGLESVREPVREPVSTSGRTSLPQRGPATRRETVATPEVATSVTRSDASSRAAVRPARRGEAPDREINIEVGDAAHDGVLVDDSGAVRDVTVVADPGPRMPAPADDRPPVFEDPVVERWRRVSAHQDGDPELRLIKRFLRGDLESLTEREARNVAKVADQYCLDQDDVLRYVGKAGPARRRDREPVRWVVPATMRSDVLHLCHSDFQAGHQGVVRTFERVRTEYHWRGMYRDVEQYVQECVDCATAKGRPRNPGPSPGNILPERPFQVLSMDFVMPLPASSKGNTALLLFQDAFTGYVMCQAMNDTSAPAVAEVYERVVFQRFGASAYIRHDQDPRFMSEVFDQFRRMIQSRQRATLAYRPQANGQQERSVQTIIRSVRAYVEQPDQDDWEDVVNRLMLAINTSFDTVRKDTPFFLLHGWDAKTTVTAMLERPPRGRDQLSAYLWRLSVLRTHELARAWARDLQEEAKKSRAEAATAHWNQLPDKFKAGFEVGQQVWLYMARVRAGLSRKLAHAWHGPFRIAEKDEEFRVRLEIAGTPYRIAPWVHVSRLKPRIVYEDRPGWAEPANVPEEDDLDAAILPEDSWEPDEAAGQYAIEEILDVRWTSPRTRNGRRVKEFLVRWSGYDEPEWVPIERMDSGRLLYEFEAGLRARGRFEAMQTGDEPAAPTNDMA